METVFLHYPDLTIAPNARKAIVAIGMFDGVHRGHQAVIEQALAISHREKLPCAVFTFVTHPRSVLRSDHPVPLLSVWSEKCELMERMGVDLLIGAHFTAAFSEIAPREFVTRILQEQLRARHVVVGYNFAFGHQQAGDIDTLRAYSSDAGFEVTVLPPLSDHGEAISSSRIRELLAMGHVAEANALLGRPYAMTGSVVQGDQRGRTLGFPTANLASHEQKLWPAYGVYVARARWQGRVNPCVLNLGMRPTFDPPQPRIEAHLLDFDGDLYGETMTLEFLQRLRPEAAFASVTELVEQIRQDVSQARTLFSSALGGKR